MSGPAVLLAVALQLQPLLQLPAVTPTPTATPRPVPAAPMVVVERFVTTPTQFIRLTLFDNRIAVVSQRHGDRVVVRRRLLEPVEFEVYRTQAVAETAAVDERELVRSLGTEPPIRAELHLGPGSGATPRQLAYSPMLLHDLPLERLQALLDDLEAQVLATPPSQVELADWQPRVGDRVELANGHGATVIRIEDGGVVVLEHDITHIQEIVPPAGRTAAIHRLSDPGR